MLSEIYYLVRSRKDGQYLAARIKNEEKEAVIKYLLVFREQYEALSYLNTHAKSVASNFGVESVSGTQLKNTIQRWGFKGIGLVNEPLEPKVQFLTYEKGFNF